jgi:probable F420-dependent oxidoreductase
VSGEVTIPGLAPLGPVGVWTFLPARMTFAEIGDVVGEIERLGYGSVWYPESPAGEPFVKAALTLAATSALAVGTGIANLWLRHAATMQATARGLVDAFPGRFLLGIGVSHRLMVDRISDNGYQRPLAVTREYLDTMDADPFGRGTIVDRPPRVLAALGDKMLELSRDRADGAHPYNATPEHTAHARSVLGPDKLLVPEQAVVLDADRDVVLARARSHLSTYLPLENYRNNWLRLGFDDSDFADGGSERLCDAVVAGGSEEAVRARVQAHLDAGADHVVIQALADRGSGLPVDQWRALAPVLSFKGARGTAE